MADQEQKESKGQKGQKEQKKHQENPQQKTREESIVRIAGKDINGSYKLHKALMRVKGISNNLAHAIVLQASKKYNMNPNEQIGNLSDEQMANIEDVINHPTKYNIPEYLINRRKSAEDGSSIHMTGNDLSVKVRQDIEQDIKIQAWRGYRHQYGQKVRGQHSRSTGRTGATIGVTKKKGMPGVQAGEQAGQAQQKSQPAAVKTAKK
jgi:small subunit ribosomal protein S13